MPFDKSKYPPNWSDVIRPRILQRDNYKCVHCGLAHRARGYRDTRGRFVECDEFMEDWAIKAGKRVHTIFLSVAHLCHDTMCEDDAHMRSLCQKCHLHYDRPTNVMKRRRRRADALKKP